MDKSKIDYTRTLLTRITGLLTIIEEYGLDKSGERFDLEELYMEYRTLVLSAVTVLELELSHLYIEHSQ